MLNIIVPVFDLARSFGKVKSRKDLAKVWKLNILSYQILLKNKFNHCFLGTVGRKIDQTHSFMTHSQVCFCLTLVTTAGLN